MHTLFERFGLVLRLSFSPHAMLVYGSAIIFTVLMVALGVDAKVNWLAQKQPETISIAWSVIPLIGGMGLPVVVPIWYIFSHGVTPLTRGVAQATLLSFALNNLLKAITGRTHPEAEYPVDLVERSQSFHFGFAETGVLEGWPSGHAMTNVAMGVALMMLCRVRWQQRLALGWALWVTLSVVFGVRGEVHWLSDSFAGAMMGGVIGLSAGLAHRVEPGGGVFSCAQGLSRGP